MEDEDEETNFSGMSLDTSRLSADISLLDSLLTSQHVCHQCSKSFPSLVSLQNHIESHFTQSFKNPREVVFKNMEICIKCHVSFPTKELLTEHVKTHTDARKMQTCHICYKSFEKSMIAKHLQLAHAHRFSETVRSPANKCDLCDGSFDTLVNFHLHKEIGHTFPCDKCKLSFVSSVELVRHKRTKHSEGSISGYYPCDECGNVFETRESYQIHQSLLHTVHCTQQGCRRRFTDKPCLLHHLKKEHSLSYIKVQSNCREQTYKS